MEIAIIVLSWILSISLVAVLLSFPINLILEKTVKVWKGSKEQKIYEKVQLGVIGATLLVLMITIVLMTLPLGG